jgi:hypothetical protein
MFRPPTTGLRNASGLALSRECTFWFWLSYGALLLAVYGLLLAELLWRLPDLIGFYLIEGLLAICAPLLVLMLCDRITLETYGSVWYDLRDRGRALLLLDPQSVETIRRELRWHPLLLWLRPPASADIRSQLLTAALWYRAIMAPEGTGSLRRYGEQLGWSFAYALLLLTGAGGLLIASGASADWLALLHGLACPAGLVFGLFAYQQLIILARRQAILDYFAVHLHQ